MKTGIVVLNWNGYEDTRECLLSLGAVEPADVLLIDNGSSDGSGERLKEEFRDIPVILNDRNLGFAGGNNVGIRYWFAQGRDAVFLLNNDTIVREPFLKILEDLVGRIPDCGVLGPAVAEAGQPHVIQSLGGDINLWTGRCPFRSRGEPLARDRGVLEVDYVLGAAFMIPRRTYERIGLLDESYFPAYFEEADYCLRARKTGLRSVVTDRAVIWHKGSRSSGGKAVAFRNIMRNKWRFERNHARSHHWAVFAPLWVGHYFWRTAIRPF